MEEKISLLKLINLDKKREQENLKNIVMENLARYIVCLENLMEDIIKLDDKIDAEKYIFRIHNIFDIFYKSSRMSFEKATILIGKELGDIQIIINNFVSEFNSKISINKEAFNKISSILEIKKNLIELEKIKEIKRQTDDAILTIKNKISKIEKEKMLVEDELGIYKKSEEYKEFIEEQEKIAQENKYLNDNISKLRQNLNLKLLSKFFHSDKKKTRLISHYTDNFVNALKNDGNLEIANIAKEAGQDIDKDTLINIKKRVENQRFPDENKKINEFNAKIKNLEQDIINKENEIVQEQNKKKKIDDKQKQIILDISEKLENRFNVKVI